MLWPEGKLPLLYFGKILELGSFIHRDEGNTSVEGGVLQSEFCCVRTAHTPEGSNDDHLCTAVSETGWSPGISYAPCERALPHIGASPAAGMSQREGCLLRRSLQLAVALGTNELS